MSYSLSFSPDFFYAEGEPYDRSDLALNEKGRPVSVYSAICLMKQKRPKAWKTMCKSVFKGVKPEFISEDSVMEKVRETDRCSDLSSPVEVWIDRKGFHTIKVYEVDF